MPNPVGWSHQQITNTVRSVGHELISAANSGMSADEMLGLVHRDIERLKLAEASLAELARPQHIGDVLAGMVEQAGE